MDSIHILFLLYLLLWSCFSTPKLAGLNQNYYGTNRGYLFLSLGSYFTAVVAAALVAATLLVRPHRFPMHFSLGMVTYTPAPCLDSL